jgi:hypothetical protein
VPISSISVACFAGVCSLTPLVFYFLWLCVVTRRERPTIISGPWDFALLLAGLSGFILFGGGLLLSLMQSNVRFLLRGNFEALRDAWGKEHLAWSLTVIVYLLFVAGGSFLTLQSRRRTLVIYNVEPDQFEAMLSEVFDHLGRPVERRGNLWVGGMPLCEVEPFAAGRTVMLRWVSEDLLLFQELERQLREAVRTLSTPDNPTTRWLTSAVAGCSALIAFGLFLILVLRP